MDFTNYVIIILCCMLANTITVYALLLGWVLAPRLLKSKKEDFDFDLDEIYSEIQFHELRPDEQARVLLDNYSDPNYVFIIDECSDFCSPEHYEKEISIKQVNPEVFEKNYQMAKKAFHKNRFKKVKKKKRYW